MVLLHFTLCPTYIISVSTFKKSPSFGTPIDTLHVKIIFFILHGSGTPPWYKHLSLLSFTPTSSYPLLFTILSSGLYFRESNKNSHPSLTSESLLLTVVHWVWQILSDRRQDSYLIPVLTSVIESLFTLFITLFTVVKFSSSLLSFHFSCL